MYLYKYKYITFYVICVLPQFLKIEIDNYLFLEEREWAYIELLGSFL